MPWVRVVDDSLNIAIGNSPDMKQVNKFGSNEDIDIGTEDIWEHGGLINWPAAATTMNVVSTSANDTSAGTGARTIQVEGLDANWEEVTDVITMNGQTDVLTTETFIRVHRVYVLTSGSGDVNAGEIHVFDDSVGSTAGIPDDENLTYSSISADHGQTLQAFYTVPANKTAYMTGFYANTDDALKFMVLKGFFRVNADLSTSTWRVGIEMKFGGDFQHKFDPHNTFPEKTDLRLQATALSANTYVAGGFDLILVDS